MIERAFVYGDLVFESIRVRNGEIRYIDDHYRRLRDGADLLEFELGAFHAMDMERMIREALGKTLDARIRFIVYRNSEGFYVPQHNRVSFDVQVFPLDLQAKVCSKITVYHAYKKPYNLFAQIKTGNALPYVMAGLHARKTGADDCIILNEHDRVAEATSSNIFIRKGNDVFTPSLRESCVNGVMRRHTIIACASLHIMVQEGKIGTTELHEADELFLTNAIQGVVPVLSYGNKSFGTDLSARLKPLLGF